MRPDQFVERVLVRKLEREFVTSRSAPAPGPFMFGAQYYRAPTPERRHWRGDLARMRELGFNHIKYWVQWRGSHRRDGSFVFDDVLELMDLAAENQLQVTLNVIFDVSPHWLFSRYPDAKQVMNNGRVIEPYGAAHRQLGGLPGPCYNHAGARAERQHFMSEVVLAFRAHPAMAMWDVWNEPELSHIQRAFDNERLACYCASCRSGFATWLQKKYGDLSRLNDVWGRCYESWDEVEMPRNPEPINDFVDFREFHIDSMTREAKWRIGIVKDLDTVHPTFLHVAPNALEYWNSVTTSADDFAMAELCDVYAASANGGPMHLLQVAAAAQGRPFYNVESHVNAGMANLHPRRVDLPMLARELVPQLGLGFTGFLFWQYRPEVLGFEAPAWGLIKPDGTDRPVTHALSKFWQALEPHTKNLQATTPQRPQVGIWKSRKNEIFHCAIHGSLQPFIDSFKGYTETLYWQSYPVTIVDGAMLEQGQLDGLRLLVMPSPYYLTVEEAQALQAWVERGGVMLSDAHLGAYDATQGRHSLEVPGHGLAASWGLRESDSLASYHLRLPNAEALRGQMTDDVRRVMGDSSVGGRYFPIQLPDSSVLFGASRYALLEGEGLSIEGEAEAGEACLVSKAIGKGRIFYAGTNLGEASSRGRPQLARLLGRLCSAAGVTRPLSMELDFDGSVRVDVLGAGDVQYVAITNGCDTPQTVKLTGDFELRGLFTDKAWRLMPSCEVVIPGRFSDLFACVRTTSTL